MVSMFIPYNEPNWTEYVLWLRKYKYPTPSSRYKGISISFQRNKPKFLVRYRGKGQYKYLGLFPLTREGEEQANQVYQKYISKLPPPARIGRVMLEKLNFQ